MVDFNGFMLCRNDILNYMNFMGFHGIYYDLMGFIVCLDTKMGMQWEIMGYALWKSVA